MGKMFDQNIKDVYDSEKEKVLDAIIKDIEKGVIKFDNTLVKLDKTTFKKNKKDATKASKRSKSRMIHSFTKTSKTPSATPPKETEPKPDLQKIMAILKRILLRPQIRFVICPKLASQISQ